MNNLKSEERQKIIDITQNDKLSDKEKTMRIKNIRKKYRKQKGEYKYSIWEMKYGISESKKVEKGLLKTIKATVSIGEDIHIFYFDAIIERF